MKLLPTPNYSRQRRDQVRASISLVIASQPSPHALIQKAMDMNSTFVAAACESDSEDDEVTSGMPMEEEAHPQQDAEPMIMQSAQEETAAPAAAAPAEPPPMHEPTETEPPLQQQPPAEAPVEPPSQQAPLLADPPSSSPRPNRTTMTRTRLRR